MAWDTTKLAGNTILSSDYNTRTTQIKSRCIPQDIDKLGSDFTGSNPTKALAITTTSQAKAAGIWLMRMGRVLHPTHEYTVTIAATTLTFTLVDLNINDSDVFDGGYFL